MRWLFLIVGGVATAAMLGISMRLNFLFGSSLGQTPEKAWVFGFVSVVSDAWKGLGPIFILALIRAQRWPSVAVGASISARALIPRLALSLTTSARGFPCCLRWRSNLSPPSALLFCRLMRKRLTVAVANNLVKRWDR